MNQLIENIKKSVRRIPAIYILVGKIYTKLCAKRFSGSESYWIKRYKKGGNSGAGSYNNLSVFKSEVLNDFVRKHDIKSVVEYGCGDGNQLKLATYRNYLGFDVSPEALSICKKIFRFDKTKKFKLMKDYNEERADLTLSLDVIYHLIEDNVFNSHMERLFSSSNRFVIIYSSNMDEQNKIQLPHVKHRKFTKWIDKNINGWKLIQYIPNKYSQTDDINKESFADFYIYQKAL